MAVFEEVTFKHPVLRVNNRDDNIDFYKKLGFKLVNEENAIAEFSTKQKTASFIIEESPMPTTRAVKGTKKINKIVVKIPNADDMTAILGNGIVIERLFKGKKGYAFETLSPEGDCFLLHSEDDIHQLVEVDNIDFPKNSELKEVSDFSFESVILNVVDEVAARAFYDDVFEGEFPLDIQFVQATGSDLATNPLETWDLEILECQVPKNYDLKALANVFETKGETVYLDKKASVLTISDLSNIEIWFIK